MAACAKCGQKVDDGLTICIGCGESLVKPGTFMEVLGWVLTVVSSVPIIIGEKTWEQNQYIPLITGGVMAVIGIILVLIGRSRSNSVENPVRENNSQAENT